MKKHLLKFSMFSVMVVALFLAPSSLNANDDLAFVADGGGGGGGSGSVTCYATYTLTFIGGTRFYRCVPGGQCTDERGKNLQDPNSCP